MVAAFIQDGTSSIRSCRRRGARAAPCNQERTNSGFRQGQAPRLERPVMLVRWMNMGPKCSKPARSRSAAGRAKHLVTRENPVVTRATAGQESPIKFERPFFFRRPFDEIAQAMVAGCSRDAD